MAIIGNMNGIENIYSISDMKYIISISGKKGEKEGSGGNG